MKTFRRVRPYVVASGALAIVIAIHGLAGGGSAPTGPGSPAPDYRATDLGGDSVALSNLFGEVILLNIWATWCPPCREEMPSMQRLYEALGPAGLRIVAVSIDAEEGSVDAGGRPGGDVADFVEEYGLTFDVWLDPSGRIQRAYRTTGVPESFIIDRDGRILRRIPGPTEWDDPAYIALFERLLAQERPPGPGSGSD